MSIMADGCWRQVVSAPEKPSSRSIWVNTCLNSQTIHALFSLLAVIAEMHHGLHPCGSRTGALLLAFMMAKTPTETVLQKRIL
jgi:hypothetical protein